MANTRKNGKQPDKTPNKAENKAKKSSYTVMRKKVNYLTVYVPQLKNKQHPRLKCFIDKEKMFWNEHIYTNENLIKVVNANKSRKGKSDGRSERDQIITDNIT